MRIHKYRAWDKTEKRMRNWEWFTDSGQRISHLFLSSDLIPLEFTGLKDNSNPPKEIYEGDIVKFCDKKRKRVVCEKVYFEYGAFWVNSREGQNEWGKVIGNIYENPELLKEI